MEIVKRKEPAEEWPKEKLPPVHREKPFFQENLEYLEALVVEAKARMAVACLREKNSFDSLAPRQRINIHKLTKPTIQGKKVFFIRNFSKGM